MKNHQCEVLLRDYLIKVILGNQKHPICAHFGGKQVLENAPTWLDRILSQTSMHLCSNFIPTVHHIELIYHKKWLSMHAKFFLSKW